MKRFVRSLTIGVLCAVCISAQSDNSARQKLIASLDALANSQLAERANSIGKIQSRADAEKRKALGRAGQVRAKELFSAEAIVPQYEELYRRVCRKEKS